MKKVVSIFLGFIMAMLAVYSCVAQNNINAKAVYSYNTDSTTIINSRVSYQTLYGNTGGIYFNKLQNKWRIWDGTQWTDLMGQGSEGAFWPLDGNASTSDDVTIDGSNTFDLHLQNFDNFSMEAQTELGFGAAGASVILSVGLISADAGDGNKIDVTTSGINITGASGSGDIVNIKSDLTNILNSNDDAGMYADVNEVLIFGGSSSMQFNVATSNVELTTPGSVALIGANLGTSPQFSITDNAFTFANGKATFTPISTRAGINLGSLAGIPSVLTNGDVWNNTTASSMQMRVNGSSLNIIGSNPSDLVTARIPFTVGDDQISSEAVLGYNSATDLMTVPNATISTNLTVSTLTSTRIPIAGTAGLIGDNSSFMFIENGNSDQVRNTATQGSYLAGSASGAPNTVYGISGMLIDGATGTQSSVQNIAGVLNIGSNTGITITPTGDIIINVTRSSCAGAPTNAIANVGGVWTLCP